MSRWHCDRPRRYRLSPLLSIQAIHSIHDKLLLVHTVSFHIIYQPVSFMQCHNPLLMPGILQSALNNSLPDEFLMSSSSLPHGSTFLILNECFLGFVFMYCTQIPCSPTACLVLDLCLVVIYWRNSFLYPLSKTCEPVPCQVRSFSPPKF
jgi:hypothetical protein